MLEVHARVERFVWNSSDSRSSSSHEDEKIVVQMKVSADNKAFHSNSKRKTYDVLRKYRSLCNDSTTLSWICLRRTNNYDVENEIYVNVKSGGL